MTASLRLAAVAALVLAAATAARAESTPAAVHPSPDYGQLLADQMRRYDDAVAVRNRLLNDRVAAHMAREDVKLGHEIYSARGGRMGLAHYAYTHMATNGFLEGRMDPDTAYRALLAMSRPTYEPTPRTPRASIDHGFFPPVVVPQPGP